VKVEGTPVRTVRATPVQYRNARMPVEKVPGGFSGANQAHLAVSGRETMLDVQRLDAGRARSMIVAKRFDNRRVTVS